jgi:hypothetical protein
VNSFIQAFEKVAKENTKALPRGRQGDVLPEPFESGVTAPISFHGVGSEEGQPSVQKPKLDKYVDPSKHPSFLTNITP